MPSRAFVPAPLVEAQPRVFKSFRGRQLKGIAMAVAGVAVVLVFFGMRDFSGYALAFAAALPGFAYGYYQPQGKPVEYWLRVLIRYYTAPQMITSHRDGLRPRWQRWLAKAHRIAIQAAAQIKPTPNRAGENRPPETRAAQIKPEPFSPAAMAARTERKERKARAR